MWFCSMTLSCLHCTYCSCWFWIWPKSHHESVEHLSESQPPHLHKRRQNECGKYGHCVACNTWGGKKTPRTFAWPFFCYRFFFFLIVLQGIVITVTHIMDLVLQTIFCMTSLPNSITSNIISRGRRQQSRRRQRCSRRQRQRQLRGSEVPRAGLGEEDFFC